MSLIEDYNELFESFRNQLTTEGNYFYGKPQPISGRTVLSELIVHITNTVFKKCFTSNDYGGAIKY